MRMIDGHIYRKTCDFQRFFDAQSVKFNPDVFPREGFVSNVHCNLIGENHKSLTAFNRVSMGDAFCVIGV